MTDVDISPSDLRFRFQLNKQLPASINIHNPSSERLAFKVKTTTPKKYVVRPSSGVVDANSTGTVQVIMQAQKEFPADFASCKDKFLVQTNFLAAGEDVTPDTFKATLHKEAKIRVILEGPPAPPSPVPEVNEGEDDASKQDAAAAAGPAPLRVAAGEEPAALSRDNKALRQQVQQLLAEKDDLQRKLSALTNTSKAAAPGRGSGAAHSSAAARRLPLLPLLLAVILAFVLGRFLPVPLELPASLWGASS